MPVIRDDPLPSAANMSARCEIDLSPGTRIVPLTRITTAARSSEPTLERGRQVRLVVAILDDDWSLQRELLLGAPARFDCAGARNDHGGLGNLERTIGAAAVDGLFDEIEDRRPASQHHARGENGAFANDGSLIDSAVST